MKNTDLFGRVKNLEEWLFTCVLKYPRKWPLPFRAFYCRVLQKIKKEGDTVSNFWDVKGWFTTCFQLILTMNFLFFFICRIIFPYSVGIFSAIQFKTKSEVDLALGSVRVGSDNFPMLLQPNFFCDYSLKPVFEARNPLWPWVLQIVVMSWYLQKTHLLYEAFILRPWIQLIHWIHNSMNFLGFLAVLIIYFSRDNKRKESALFSFIILRNYRICMCWCVISEN